MNIQNIMGYTAGALTTVAFLPQVIKVYYTKSAKDISWIMMCLFTLGVILWIIYGFIIPDGMPLIVANLVTFSLSAAILILKAYYGWHKERHEKSI